MTVSVCMIVKNEEAVLARCLDCLKGIADEIIIVDTGSTDRTKEIAAKYTDKIYSTHTGQPGGLREIPYKQMIATKPELVIKTAVKGMLPKNTLGRDMLRKLKVYRGAEHGHQAQQPIELKIKG